MHIPQTKEERLAELLADLIDLVIWDDKSVEAQVVSEFTSLLRYKLDRLMGNE